MDFIQIRQNNQTIRAIDKVETPFYPEDVTAKYLILFIDIIRIYKGPDCKEAFIKHLVTHHLPTMETPEDFKKRVMSEHTWINSYLSRLVGEYVVDALGAGSKGPRLVGRALGKRPFLQMAIGEVLGIEFFYRKAAQINKNFNAVIELSYIEKQSNSDIIVILKKTKKEYRQRLMEDLGKELCEKALDMDDELTKGVLESTPVMINITNKFSEIVSEPYCEIRGDDFCEYHIRLPEKKKGHFFFSNGFFRSMASRFLYMIPMVRTMAETLIALEIAIQRQTRDLADAQIRLEERTCELRKLNTHMTLAEEREKKTVADKLHEELGQELAMSRILISKLAHEYEGELPPDSVETLKAYIDGMIAKTRTMTEDLSPPVLHELGLDHALIWLGEKMEKEHGINIVFDIQNAPHPLTADKNIMIFRVAQELLVNVIKHAKADRVAMTFTQSKAMVRLTIDDNGIGFNLSRLKTVVRTENAGFGLYSIRDRVREAGGRFDLDSTPGNGFRATLILPLFSHP